MFKIISFHITQRHTLWPIVEPLVEVVLMRGHKRCYEIQESICQNCNFRQVGTVSWEATLLDSVLPPVFMGVNLKRQICSFSPFGRVSSSREENRQYSR